MQSIGWTSSDLTEFIKQHPDYVVRELQPGDIPGTIEFKRSIMKDRPKEIDARSYEMHTGCGSMYVNITHDKDGPFDLFASLGKSGQCGAAQIEAICRMASINLRSGIPPIAIIKQLKGIRCPSIKFDEGVEVWSCADAIAKALEKEVNEYWADKEKDEKA